MNALLNQKQCITAFSIKHDYGIHVESSINYSYIDCLSRLGFFSWSPWLPGIFVINTSILSFQNLPSPWEKLVYIVKRTVKVFFIPILDLLEHYCTHMFMHPLIIYYAIKTTLTRTLLEPNDIHNSVNSLCTIAPREKLGEWPTCTTKKQDKTDRIKPTAKKKRRLKTDRTKSVGYVAERRRFALLARPGIL